MNHDVMTPEQRSRCMSAIHGADTKPELAVRRLLHGMGYRFRLHVANLPGRPDIVLPRYRTAILVNGCFWHQHPGCRYAYMPKTRRDFWEAKLKGNSERDRLVEHQLTEAGWRAIVVWECELRDPAQLAEGLSHTLIDRRIS